MNVLAFDVSKDTLDGFDGSSMLSISNEPKAIGKLLKRYSTDWVLILEPTSIYHMELAEKAHKKGMTVYLVNPRVIGHFRETRSRIKSDEVDAECLHAFCMRNWEDLRPWSPLAPAAETLRKAIKRYHHVTKLKVALAQSMAGCKLAECEACLASFRVLQDELERQAIEAAEQLDADLYKRLKGITGFGPYSACAFTYMLRSRKFESADAVRAFIGLDLVFRDSGKKKGTRAISKCGDSTLRHAACCAGRGLLNSNLGRAVNQSLKAKGRKPTECLVIAAKKLTRIAFGISQNGQTFNPENFCWGT